MKIKQPISTDNSIKKNNQQSTIVKIKPENEDKNAAGNGTEKKKIKKVKKTKENNENQPENTPQFEQQAKEVELTKPQKKKKKTGLQVLEKEKDKTE